MNSRERFFTTMDHNEPDRVPFVVHIYQELVDKLQSELPNNIDYRDYYHEDIRLIPVEYPEYKNINFADNYFPLPSSNALKKAKEQIEEVKHKGLVTCNTYVPGIFEHIKAFTSDEYALVHMMLEPEDMHLQIEKVTQWLCNLYELFAEIGFDICFNGDDLGTQRSTIMSLDCYREFYKPHHLKLVNKIHKTNSSSKVAFHCCGYIETIIQEWIDIGVDIIHSIQPEANNLKLIKNKFGDKIVFWGAMGLQSEFYYLSPGEMSNEIRKTLQIMAPGGGYIAATSNFVTGEVGIDKVKILYNSLNEYGSYDVIKARKE